MGDRRRVAILGAAAAAMAALAGGPGVATPGSHLIIAPASNPAAPPALSSIPVTGHSRRAEIIGRSFGTGRHSYKNWPPRTVAQDKRDARKRRNRLRQKRAVRRAR